VAQSGHDGSAKATSAFGGILLQNLAAHEIWGEF
jgi:hypothetical protein